jgi:hypothetical protein
MAADLMELAAAMARREAAAQLLPAPFVPTDGAGTRVAVRQVSCRACGATARDRRWPPPFQAEGAGSGPLLTMLACETVTARAVLPIVVVAERFPELRGAEFWTRAVCWHALSPGLWPQEALAAVAASEQWIDTPGRLAADVDTVPTLPASTRRYRPGTDWRRHRADLVPHFLSPHRNLPSRLGDHYAAVWRAAVRDGNEGS